MLYLSSVRYVEVGKDAFVKLESLKCRLHQYHTGKQPRISLIDPNYLDMFLAYLLPTCESVFITLKRIPSCILLVTMWFVIQSWPIWKLILFLVSNVEQKSQRFIPVSDTGESIAAIQVSPDRHVFAVAQASPVEPSLHVYDLHTFRKRRKIALSNGVTVSAFF